MEQYIDYVEYTFSVKNKSDKTILMDTLEDISDTMYITTKTNKTGIGKFIIQKTY